jgi:fumarate hydratase, class II
MNVCKPLIVHKTQHAINVVIDGWANLSWFLADGTRPNLKKFKEYIARSLMPVTALTPAIGYDKAWAGAASISKPASGGSFETRVKRRHHHE